MPESKNRLRRRVYKKKRIDFDSIRWGNVLLALAGCVVVVVGAVFGLRALFSTLTSPRPIRLQAPAARRSFPPPPWPLPSPWI